MKYIIKLIPLAIIAVAYFGYDSGKLHSASYNYDKATYAYNGWEKSILSGKDLSRNPQKALKHYKIAAEKGHVKAQVKLAFMYYKGDGTDQDIKLAVYWWEKAAEKNSPWALNNLGTMYMDGEGVEKDLEKAIELLQKATDLGQKDAQFNLKIAKGMLSGDDDAITSAAFQRQIDREKSRQDRLRRFSIYNQLKTLDETKGFSGVFELSNSLVKNPTTNVADFLQIQLFLEDKTKNLHEEQNVDTRYYLHTADINYIYSKLLRSKKIRHENLIEWQNQLTASVTKYYQWRLLTEEDLSRCQKAETAQNKFNLLIQEKDAQFKEGIHNQGKLFANTIKMAVLNTSKLASSRNPTTSICDDDMALIEDSDWKSKREEISKRLIEEHFTWDNEIKK